MSMRTKGAALATACDWLMNYAVVRNTLPTPLNFRNPAHTSQQVQTTPIGIHRLQWGLYLIYAVFNAAFVPLVYYFVVETSGRGLEETDRWFQQNPGWFVHKANHSRGVELSGAAAEDGMGLMGVADDHEAMMRAFEESEDEKDDRSSAGGSL